MAILEGKHITVMRKKGSLPNAPFLRMKEYILGKAYELTISFISEEESRARNHSYRKKNYPTNILSFPLSKHEGEIYICLSVARKDAKKFSMSAQKFLHLLLVHGMLHLKGHKHGSTMETLEDTYLRRFYRGV